MVGAARAERLWSMNQAGTVGREIKAAARCIEDAAVWMPEEPGARLLAMAAQAAAAGEKLLAGAACTKDEVERALMSLGTAIEALRAYTGA